MKILCRLIGHKFEHDGRGVGCWSRAYIGGAPVGGWYMTLCVQKTCGRCGFVHAYSFIAPDVWMDKPEDSGA